MLRSVVRFCRLTIGAIALCCCAAGAIAQETAGAYYEDALQRYREGDAPAALIQLKNALVKDGQHVPSLILIGELFLEMKEPVAAEDAFTEALLFGADLNYVAPKLAAAYLRQGKYEALLKELPAEAMRGRTRAEMLGFHGLAYLSLNDMDAARRAIDEGFSIDTHVMMLHVARINLQIAGVELEAALHTAQALVDGWPGEAEAWDRLGLVNQALGNTPAALDAYAAALDRDPDYSNTRLSRAALFVDLRRFDEAAADLDAYSARYPLDPRSLYLQAQVKQSGGDIAGSRELYQAVFEVLQALPSERVLDDQQLTMIGAMASGRLGNFEFAKTYLDAYLELDPDNTEAVLMQAGVLLELGDAERALRLLKPIHTLDGDNPAVRDMMIRIYTQSDRHESAIKLLSGLGDQLVPGSDAYTLLAVNRLSVGQTLEGLTALEEAYRGDNSRLGAGFALALTYLDMGRAHEAAVIAGELLLQAPGNLAYLNLLGLANLEDGHIDGARRAFSDAIEIAPDFLAPHVGLARTERVAGNTAAAQALLEDVLKADRQNVSALMEMARLHLAMGKQRNALNWAEQAGRAAPDSLLPVLLLVEVYLADDQLDAAEDAARRGVVLFDGNLAALDALATVQSLAGKPADSLQTYRRMQKIAGFNTDQLYRIARKQMQIGGWDDARYTLYNALKGRPQDLPSMLASQQVLRVLGELNEALQLADEILVLAPDSGQALGQRAMTLFALQQYDAAAQEYRKALAVDANPRWQLGLYQVLAAQQRNAEAEAVLREALAQAPEEALLRNALIDVLLEQGRWAEAKPELEAQIQRFPEDAALLNNLAYTLNEMGDPRALEVARTALEVDPGDALVNDTLGWILVTSGSPAEGLPYLREASSREARNPQISYHLGVALQRLGRDSEALAQLNQALSTGSSFPEQELAGKLVRTLRAKL